MAARVAEYATFCVPLGSDAVVTVSVAGRMVSESVALAFCTGEPESVTLKVNETGGTTGNVGVPLISPLAAFSDNPVGKVPEVNCQV